MSFRVTFEIPHPPFVSGSNGYVELSFRPTVGAFPTNILPRSKQAAKNSNLFLFGEKPGRSCDRCKGRYSRLLRDSRSYQEFSKSSILRLQGV